MLSENNCSSPWVRNSFGLSGCFAILMLPVIEFFGVPISASVAWGVVTYSVATAYLSFGYKPPTEMQKLLPDAMKGNKLE
jgi:hypothetical protein